MLSNVSKELPNVCQLLSTGDGLRLGAVLEAPDAVGLPEPHRRVELLRLEDLRRQGHAGRHVVEGLPRGQGLGLLPLLLHELRGARESRVGKPDLQFITSSIQMLRIKN